MSRIVYLVIVPLLISAALVSLGCQRRNLNEARKGVPESGRLIESVQGPELYRAYCASCHGPEGRGDGPAASSLKNVPDLTRIAARNGGVFPSALVQHIIAGDNQIAAHGSRQMPVWGPIFQQIEWDKDVARLCTINLAKQVETYRNLSDARPSRLDSKGASLRAPISADRRSSYF